MPKILVKPSTPMMLLLDNRESMEPCRPSVVTQQSYLNNFIADGRVNVLVGDLPEEVMDADFKAHYEASRDKEGKADEDLAISSFKAEVPKLVRKARKELSEEDKAAQDKDDAEAKAAADAKAAEEAKMAAVAKKTAK